MTLCAHSARYQSTITRGRSTGSRGRWNLTVSTMHSTRSAAPTLAGASAHCRRGGTLVGFVSLGAHGKLVQLAMFVNIFVGARLRGRVGKFYGITMLYRKDTKPLREDLPKIFALLAEKKIDPDDRPNVPAFGSERGARVSGGGIW